MRTLTPFFSAIFLLVLASGFPSTAISQDSNRGGSGQSVEQFVRQALKANDRNKDGEVSEDEAGPLLRRNFANVDADGNGIVTAGELTDLAKRMKSRSRNPNDKATAKIAIPDNVLFEADVAYRDGNSKWKLDLARPKISTDGRRPAIVFIHGGGWASGDKGGGIWRSLPLEYASRGYVCVSVNYRLTDEANVLDCIADCKCAVRWLRTNANKYGVDPDRIGAFGNSAGAHLVSVLGLATRDAGLEGDGPFQEASSLVQAVCCSAPPADFLNWENRYGNRKSPLSRLFGDEDSETAARRASPVTYASDKAPPFLVIHGTADKTVPIAQGDALRKALVDAGANDVTYLRIDGAGHGVFSQSGKKTQPAMQEFFDRVLIKAGEAH